MKVLFVSMPHKSHFYPMLPLAWALRAAGHEVRVASNPDFNDAITESGLTAVPVGTTQWYMNDPWEPVLFRELMSRGASEFIRTFDWAKTDRQAWSWEGLLALEKILVSSLFGAINTDPTIDELVAYARHWRPDLVIWEQLTFAGAVVAQVMDVPHARFISGLDFNGRARQEFIRLRDLQPTERREDPTREWLEETMRRFGGAWTEELRTGQVTIDPTAPSTRLKLNGRTVGVRYVPHHGPSVVPDWLRKPADRKRICLTLGLSNEIDKSPATIGEILTGLADLDVEVVATLSAAQVAEIGELPGNIRVVDFVPLHDLMPTCAAIVHHGGAGTRLTAEYHAVPQLVIGHGYDTLSKGLRLEELGAGLFLPAESATPVAIRERTIRLLTEPALAAGAAKLQADLLAEPTPAEVVSTLQHLVDAAGAA
ncbi:activator-dependent family glycosyltransferase [Streptomyces sp. DT24]|uniref:activator-dependent family glycosyltransferase n=1 Tax=unclassified Streptomyces TaxID=2593676 RepID=UPI003CF9CC6D